ncbi:zinc-binding alcohol dehydrogenase family protein [Chryseobacterium sp.]|uniref:quinone oxidoreductase family protein n=1 Tax=Chryseobacterium sp. TaxID=1871047 RepID=UPI0025BE774F|nr:zinc-binding alcohol dehydrogenase family protein [Chryseobacterium sp.]
MKAAVILEKGGTPQYTDYKDPEINNDNEVLIAVKAAAIKHLDRARASGKHYSTENEEQKPKLIGSDGVGFLKNGVAVYFFSKKGTVAEKAVAEKKLIVPIPEGLDFSTAAALPNAVMGSAMALQFKAKLKTGEVVLINGATGITGKVAIQIAKIYGAKKVIVTGRNEEILSSLHTVGADEVISLNVNDENFKRKIKDIHSKTPIDIVIDYVWGHSTELLLSALKGDGTFSHKTRLVSVGGMGGDIIQLSSQILRGTDIQISGSGLGSWSPEEFKLLISKIIPEMFQAALEGKLIIETQTFPLKDIAAVWEGEISNKKRIVISI